MDKIKPGLVDVVNEVIAGLKEPFEKFADMIYGVTIRRSEHVKRGEFLRLEANRKHGRILMIHPLDAIAMEFPTALLTQSDEVALYFTDWAHRRLDQVAANLGSLVAEGNERQEDRMAAWMVEHGVSREMLAACTLLEARRKGDLPRLTSVEEMAKFLKRNPATLRYIEMFS